MHCAVYSISLAENQKSMNDFNDVPLITIRLLSPYRHRFHEVRVLRALTLKGPGFFVYLKSGGGGFRPPPPRISAAERRKILKFGTYVELVNTNVLTKFQYLKSKPFLIMQIYVNYVHVFLFLTITDKIRPFGALKFV